MSEPRKVTIHKSFFKKERDGFYSDWFLAFWRELFQNSVDAGSENIRIYLDQKEGRGSFGNYRSDPPNVVRVVFADDGCGMSYDVLDDVYFAIGHTTKTADDGSVGGFGRARLMTCFSQDRYSILTQDNFVVGEGGDFDIYPLDTALAKLDDFERDVKTQSAAVETSSNTSLQGIWRDREMVKAAIAQGGYKGCRVEVDLETERDPSYHYGRPASLERMKAALKTYLSESQIKPNVTINDMSPEAYFQASEKIETKKGRAKDRLSVGSAETLEEFATVYVVKKPNTQDTAKLIVRVDGAAMFSTHIGTMTGSDVVLEIDPKKSRSVLNSNRDGLNAIYRKEVDAFTQQLATDVNSALMKKEAKNQIMVKGEHGAFESRAKTVHETLSSAKLEGLMAKPYVTTDVRKAAQFKTAAQLHKAGMTFDMTRSLIKGIKYHEGPLNELVWELDSGPLRSMILDFVEKVRERSFDFDISEDVFVELCPDELKPWIIDAVVERMEASRTELRVEHEKRLKNLHDVRISILSTNDKTKASIRRNHPDNWDTSTGAGKVPHMLLTAWNTALSIAIEKLFEVRPHLQPVKWRSGWIYSVPELEWQGDAVRPGNFLAVHQRSKDDHDMHELLLNPVDTDGKIAYSLSDDHDLWRLMVRAVHEVTHILNSPHNEDYTKLNDDITREIFPSDAIRRIRTAVKATSGLYRSGKYQALDNEPGPRPVERLSPNGVSIEGDRIRFHDDEDDTLDQERRYG
ncbi:ATP-binding protein [Rhizobium sp. MHM7A]|uniref:ATP-binding protein n=1 Tax=Rhizobium sp. MHM7A TaxID=2583233 RepID=UPI001106991F|nr:ATP-binding protein [Rhizobium sp. MHM7A]TLX16985.1 hypothetical protein FFR93_06605 [Rhizobium sp. MHM7A]